MDEIQELEQLLQSFLSGIQEVLQSGEILSDEFQGELANTLSALTTRIDELKAAQTPAIPPLDKAPFQSAVISSFKYDPKKQDLYIKFQGDYPLENGNTYKYSGVPAFISNLLMRGAVAPKTSGANQWHAWKKGVTPSLGAALDALIKKGGYPYQKLT